MLHSPGTATRSPDSNSSDFFFLWGHLKTLMRSGPIENEQTLNERISDTRQTIHNRQKTI
jgi:hypothetical protein